MDKKYIQPDLDVDVKNRDDVLKCLKHIPASKLSNAGIFPHGVGVYFCDVPNDLISGLCSIDYKRAEEEYGYVKVDILHNTIYDSFETRTQMLKVLNQNPNWDLLNNEDIVKTLPHIGNYYNLMIQLPRIDTIEKLAMFIALIRPGKKQYIDIVKENGWNSIENVIWKKEDNGYQYKKSHAISYATMITLALNKYL